MFGTNFTSGCLNSTDRPIIGLSATPWARGLGLWFDDLVIGSTMAQLQRTLNPLTGRTFLTPYRVFAPTSIDLKGIRTVAGDFHKGQLSELMRGRKIVGDVATTWVQRGENRPTFVFCVDLAHARTLQSEFKELGVAAGFIEADTSRAEREELRKDFANGAIRVVCSVGTLTAGVDWDVRAIVDARPTKSKMLFVQMLGRGCRSAEGKTDCLVLSHSNNFLVHGFPQDIVCNELQDGKREIGLGNAFAEAKIPTPCPECQALFKCEHRRGPTQAEFVMGEIGELDPFFIPGARQPKPAAKKPEHYSHEEKQAFYSGLVYLCRERGYKSGWSANQYRDRFGVYPRGMFDIPTPPGPDVIAFERRSRIRYVKAREAQTRA